MASEASGISHPHQGRGSTATAVIGATGSYPHLVTLYLFIGIRRWFPVHVFSTSLTSPFFACGPDLYLQVVPGCTQSNRLAPTISFSCRAEPGGGYVVGEH